MRYSRHIAGVIAGAALLLGMAQSSQAQTTESESPSLLMDFGMSAAVGGGLVGFTDSTTRDFANIGGSWEARFTLGTRSIVGFEAAYRGAAQSVDALGLDSNAILLSTGIEGLARLNVLQAAGKRNSLWQPYLLAGVGWRRYDVTNADFNTSSVNDEDNVMEFPLGAGVSYRFGNLLVDLRGVLRLATDNDLVRTQQGTSTDLHTWEGSLRVGWEF